MSSPSATASTPPKPDETYCYVWYAFKTAELRQMEKSKASGHHGSIMQVFRAYNVTLSRLPDLSNLAPAQQFLQLAAVREYHIDSAICTLAAMGVAAAKAPNPVPPATNLQRRQREETPSPEEKRVAQEVKHRGFGHPKWTPAAVAVAEFVPSGQGKMNAAITSNQKSESRDEISKPGMSSDTRPRHLDKQQTQLGGAQKDVGGDLHDKGEKQNKMDARKLLDIKLDSRLRSHTIEFEPSSLEPAGGSDIATDARAGRSLSSPPKVSFSEIKQLTATSKHQWDPSWFGSARTASGESQEETKAPPRNAIVITNADGTARPAVYKVPQRRTEAAAVRKLPTLRVETSAAGSPNKIAEPKDIPERMAPTVKATGATASSERGYPAASTGDYPRSANGYIATPIQSDSLAQILQSSMTEQLNISPRRPPVISAVPSYPANAPIPSVSRTQPYTNVIPRTDQIPQHGHEWPHVSRQTPNHYPVDLRNLKIRPTAVPIVRHPQDRFRNTEYECYKENSRSPVPQMYHRSFQYEPRYGAVRNGRDVRTGHGIPRGPHGRDAPRTDEEPEDTELELMNNIPYRLRPVPLTGPRCIR